MPLVEIAFRSPNSALPATSLDWGRIWVGRTGVLTPTIQNTGEIDVTLVVPRGGADGFTWGPIWLPLPTGRSVPVPITFKGIAEKNCAAVVTAMALAAGANPVRATAELAVRAQPVRMAADWLDASGCETAFVALDGSPEQRTAFEDDAALSLHAEGDTDWFRVRLFPGPLDGLATGAGTTRTGLGVEITTLPPVLRIELDGEVGDQPYDLGVKYIPEAIVYTSEGFVMGGEIAIGAGTIEIPWPGRLMPDLECYVAVGNPDYAGQGPFTYGVRFDYRPFSVIVRGGAFQPDRYRVVLKRYWDAKWRPDPPRNEDGLPYQEGDWLSGRAIPVADLARFLAGYADFVSDPALSVELSVAHGKSATAALALEYATIADVAASSGLREEARDWYTKSATLYHRARLNGAADAVTARLAGAVPARLAGAERADAERADAERVG